MRDAIFILFVIFVLLGLTAIKYRKQIANLMELARVIKGTAIPGDLSPRNFPENNTASIPLVNCSKCGVWVPQNKARKLLDIFFCSDECVQAARKPA